MADIIKIGTQDATFKVGSSAVTAIFLGSTQVYPEEQPVTDFKYKLTLQDSSVVSAACDGTSAITSGEVSSQYSGTVVGAEIGQCVTSIGDKAFFRCSGLTSCTIGTGVTSIGTGAFFNCSGLTSIDIPNSVTSIGQDAFRNCSGLTSIEIPNSVTSIGQHAFDRCSGLISVDIGSGVTSIGNYAFYNCSGLTSCTIGTGVTSIGVNAFKNCSGLTSITVNAATPPTLGSNAFNNTNDCPIYVPCESVEDYQTAWSTYASRITCIPTHEYVDLELPSGTLWATMNIGASSETDYGNYYKYGYGTKQYSAETTSAIYYTGTENPLASSADTVVQEWGGNWHTPTFAQFRELSANTTYTWETDFNGSGINGGKFTAQNGKYVFFPAGGNWNNGTQTNVGSYGYYWASTPASYQPTKNAYYMSEGSSSFDVNIYYRYAGYNIRGVIG